ncbi:MAG: N-6 DNA methylase [Microcystis sp. M015S1]|uniref:N-6 DNA methylase n=1 Tax=unclassified Microcystis TaxID=2643300 RepID=UPI00258CAC5C|nr:MULTISPECIES: N-6 DNA methylase [unclassified Microcystis]MCA2936907.1 N-6 DNA methylase [Microcystis sp. M015S1]MCA3161633.1 N-6 DNA methylase [Burkholderiales bacterium]MCA2920242.1 N-6 DNA methylase [Microcystis sp. M017S1]MCA2945652.1 N-6 DNA methylase [Microcystis sp. M011S1]MCA3171996.1 N-6 DNA methylase [Burkholderiales bacterium]
MSNILKTYPVVVLMARMMKSADSNQVPLLIDEISPKDAFRNIRNYLAGQFVGATRDDALLDEVLKCLFCKLLIEREKIEPINLSVDPFSLSKQLRSAFNIVRSEFTEIYTDESEILLDPKSLSYVMNQLNFSIMDAESDPIGDAFEVFVGSESRGNSGQFFTPRSVTNLLVQALDPKGHETILDPACGAGGFLASACAHLERQGVPAKNISTNLYGIDKDNYLSLLSKAHIALLTGGHPTIINGDSISLQNGVKSIGEYLPTEGVDVILTNPPFGVRIVSGSPEILKTFKLSRKWAKNSSTGVLEPSDKVQSNVPPQVLFVERCLSLLKPGGRLGMVLPESILSNKSYRNVVEFLLDNADIHAVIGMPEALFKTSGKGGTHTKTCLLVATKNKSQNIKNNKTLFMAEAKWCGQDSRARSIPHNDLPAIAENYSKYKKKKLVEISNLGFSVDKDAISNGVLCPRYYDPMAGEELNGLGKSHLLIKFSDLIEQGVISIKTGDEVGKLAYGTGNIPFIRTSDISNWELKADPKHGVSEEIYNTLKKKQDVRTGDILMVKDGTYLIGTCAIVSDADNEILYQSHLYKIRVNENKYGLDSYLLLALLSSTAVQKQIRSKQFTQDIIDSLGERINELVIPIPKSKVNRSRISDLVRSAVIKRIEARELTKEARECVAL